VVGSVRPGLVSVIVPTRNSDDFLERCLVSIRAQSYASIQLVVVDNHSTDRTVAIARRYADCVVTAGPERSAQVNRGAALADGEYIYRVDSDFVLEPTVVEECVRCAASGFDAVVVHNSPDETVSWIARLRKFEVDMYKYDLDHSAARFVRAEVFRAVGGYNEAVTAGEDYDFQNRLGRAGYRTGFVDPEALHLGEPRRLLRHLVRYFEYGRDFVNYRAHNEVASRRQLRFIRPVYVRQWRRFFARPGTAVLFVFYNVLKYSFALAGYIVARVRRLGSVGTAKP
jgi:glycosyltransferase involved in cell wall biosynthesis